MSAGGRPEPGSCRPPPAALRRESAGASHLPSAPDRPRGVAGAAGRAAAAADRAAARAGRDRAERGLGLAVSRRRARCARRPRPVHRRHAAAGASGLSIAPARQEPPTTLGGAVVVLDYNRDGRPDLFFVNGAPWPWEDAAARAARHLRAVPQRRRRPFHRCDPRGRARRRDAGHGGGRGRLRQRRLSGPLHHRRGREPALSQPGRRHVRRGDRGRGRRRATARRGAPARPGSTSTATAGSTSSSPTMRAGSGDVDLATAFSIALMGHSYGAPTGFVGAPPSVYRNLGHGRFALGPGRRRPAQHRSADAPAGGQGARGRAARCQRRRPARPAVHLSHGRQRAFPQPGRRHVPPLGAGGRPAERGRLRGAWRPPSPPFATRGAEAEAILSAIESCRARLGGSPPAAPSASAASLRWRSLDYDLSGQCSTSFPARPAPSPT